MFSSSVGLLYFCVIRAPWRKKQKPINLRRIYKSSMPSFWICIQVVKAKSQQQPYEKKRESEPFNTVPLLLKALYFPKYFVTLTAELLSLSSSHSWPSLSIPGLLQLVNVARQAHLDLPWSAFRGSPNIQSQSAAMKNPPRHNLKSRKTEEAAPPEKNSLFADDIAAQRAMPRQKKAAHSCRYNWRCYTCKTRSWIMINASEKVDGCPGGSSYFILPLSKKSRYQREGMIAATCSPLWWQPVFIFIGYFLRVLEPPLVL